VTGADCLPIVFVTARAVAAAHSGWRGTADHLPDLTLAALCAVAACGPEHVRVHLGPCIRGCCYAVGPEVARRFPAAAVDRSGPNLRLDIVIATRIQLLDAGVAASALSDAGACTSCQPAWYFSHRRDAGRTGRHWGVVAKRPPATKSTTVPYDGGAGV
jgi:purine-nucleoside/S-methyl-5'-thioadenosine phosphorylase / adenosine deaminase